MDTLKKRRVKIARELDLIVTDSGAFSIGCGTRMSPSLVHFSVIEKAEDDGTWVAVFIYAVAQ